MVRIINRNMGDIDDKHMMLGASAALALGAMGTLITGETWPLIAGGVVFGGAVAYNRWNSTIKLEPKVGPATFTYTSPAPQERASDSALTFASSPMMAAMQASLKRRAAPDQQLGAPQFDFRESTTTPPQIFAAANLQPWDPEVDNLPEPISEFPVMALRPESGLMIDGSDPAVHENLVDFAQRNPPYFTN